MSLDNQTANKKLHDLHLAANNRRYDSSPIDREEVLALYKLILADTWHHLDEEDKFQLIENMVIHQSVVPSAKRLALLLEGAKSTALWEYV